MSLPNSQPENDAENEACSFSIAVKKPWHAPSFIHISLSNTLNNVGCGGDGDAASATPS